MSSVGFFLFSSFSRKPPLNHIPTNSPSTFPPLIPNLTHTHPHTLVDALQLHYTEWKECQMNRGGPLLVSQGCRRGSWLNLHKVWRECFSPSSPYKVFFFFFLFLLHWPTGIRNKCPTCVGSLVWLVIEGDWEFREHIKESCCSAKSWFVSAGKWKLLSSCKSLFCNQGVAV